MHLSVIVNIFACIVMLILCLAFLVLCGVLVRGIFDMIRSYWRRKNGLEVPALPESEFDPVPTPKQIHRWRLINAALGIASLGVGISLLVNDPIHWFRNLGAFVGAYGFLSQALIKSSQDPSAQD